MTEMQFGLFTIGDVTEDPTTGKTPTESERIIATVAVAQKAEEVGVKCSPRAEHHNPPVRPLLADDTVGLSRRPNRAPHPV